MCAWNNFAQAMTKNDKKSSEYVLTESEFYLDLLKFPSHCDMSLSKTSA